MATKNKDEDIEEEETPEVKSKDQREQNKAFDRVTAQDSDEKANIDTRKAQEVISSSRKLLQINSHLEIVSDGMGE